MKVLNEKDRPFVMGCLGRLAATVVLTAWLAAGVQRWRAGSADLLIGGLVVVVLALYWRFQE